MAQFILTGLTAAESAVVCHWAYGAGCGPYDLSPADTEAILLPDLRYYAVRQDGRLAGLACFGEDARVFGGPYGQPALDVGCALDPALVGQGRGRPFATAVVDFAARTYRANQLRLSVALANQRAIRVFEAIGFVPRRRFAGITRGGIHPFLVMTRG